MAPADINLVGAQHGNLTQRNVIQNQNRLVAANNQIVGKVEQMETDLQNGLEKLNTSGLPASRPDKFGKTESLDCTFRQWSEGVENYLACKGIEGGEKRVRILLTFIVADVLRRVTRAKPTRELIKMEWNEVVNFISRIVDFSMTEMQATIMLQRLSQGLSKLRAFTDEIEKLGELAYPATCMIGRNKAMIATLIRGMHNRSIAYQLYNYQTKEDGSHREFMEVRAKAIELTGLLDTRDEDSFSAQFAVLNVDATDNCDAYMPPQNNSYQNSRQNLRRCYRCQALDHYIADCPETPIEEEMNDDWNSGDRRCFRCNSPSHLVRFCDWERDDNSYQDDTDTMGNYNTNFYDSLDQETGENSFDFNGPSDFDYGPGRHNDRESNPVCIVDVQTNSSDN